MSVLVVGSVALDSVETPSGRVEEALGGSATYFSTAASIYTDVKLVGVVGYDFPHVHLNFLKGRRIDVGGLQVEPGQTFRWAGRYSQDLNTAHTLDTQLNVFASFHPELPPGFETAEYVLLANIDPDLQIEVLRQVRAPRLSALDTMNYWISSKRASLERALSMVDVVLMNEAELRQFAGEQNLPLAARCVLSLGPKAVVVKKGEHGAVLFGQATYFGAPAYPLETVKDPTGAGDSFAGGFIGYLASMGDCGVGAMCRAVIHGSVVASFCVQDFSVDRLATLTRDEIDGRYGEFRRFTHFDSLD